MEPLSAGSPAHVEIDDARRLEALRRGSQAAWDEAFRLLYPIAFYAARHPSADLTPSEAEDVAIETLTQAVSKVASVDHWNGLKALIATMAQRRAISLRRKKYADKRGGPALAAAEAAASAQMARAEQEGREPVEETGEPGPRGLDATELLELKELLDTALGAVDATTGQLLRAFLLEGTPYKDLATKFRMPIGTVGVNLARGLKKIRTQLEANPRLLKELRAHLR